MPGILDVAAMVRAIGSAATASAEDVRNADYEIRRAQSTGESASAGVSGGSGNTGGLGASVSFGSNTNVTSRGMSNALSIARRSL